jgi:preprotein translocase subunit SecD
MIHGRFDSQSAAELRDPARGLPVGEDRGERTLGPALGADSIRSGIRAGVVGSLAVAWRSRAGTTGRPACAATVAYVSNFVLMGIMALSGATLTMPGIAGLVLTIGTAIDSTVVIYERIRETPRGRCRARDPRLQQALLDDPRRQHHEPDHRARALYQYGTGPIKGFAVTLSIRL